MVEAIGQNPLARPPLLHPPSVEELAARFRGKDIVMVGNGPTGKRDYTSLGLPIWVVNGGWQWHAGAELCWMMDDLEGPAWDNVGGIDPVAEPDQKTPEIEHLGKFLAEPHNKRIEHSREYWEPITQRCCVPIMTAKAYPDKFPQSLEYPLEEVLSRVHPRVYLAETVCFAAAWALHIGVKSISFGGCDYGGVRPAERAGLEYWIGRLEEAGIPVKVFPGSTLLQTGPLDGKNRHVPGVYGREEWDLPFDNGYELGDFPEGTGLPDDSDGRLGSDAMEALLAETDIKSVLEIGYGAGEDGRHMASAGKRVLAVDPAGEEGFNDQHNGGTAMFLKMDYLDPETLFSEKFDAIWTCHVLEHVHDPHAFLSKCFSDLHDDGLLAITVPPAQHAVVGGHFTLWNAGLLLYHLVLAGFDCESARVKQYGYNLSVLVRKQAIPLDAIPSDPNYPVERLRAYFPPELNWENGTFNGNIEELNWR